MPGTGWRVSETAAPKVAGTFDQGGTVALKTEALLLLQPGLGLHWAQRLP